MRIPFSNEIVRTSAGNYEWMATTQPEKERETYFDTLWAGEDNLLRTNESGAIWGMTPDKHPRKARKGERAYYEFLHTIISSKRRFPINLLFQEPKHILNEQGELVGVSGGDGTSFTEILFGQFDAQGLLSAFKQAGRFKNVQVDGQWDKVEQPEDQWEATIDVLLTVTEKDNKYTQTALADRFNRTGYTAGITRMEAQDAKRPFVRNLEGSPRKVHYSIQPKDFSDIPF